MNTLRKTTLLMVLTVLLVSTGCNGVAVTGTDPQTLEHQALQCLHYSGNSGDVLLAMQAVETSVQLRLPKAPDLCMQVLSVSPAPLRHAGAMGLIDIPTPAAKQQLTALLSDPDESVRLAAIGALYKLGDTQHTQKLIDALASPDQKVRGVALTVLGRMGDKSAVPAITPLLEAESVQSVRLQAAEALVLLRDENVLPKLQLWQYSTDYQERVFSVHLMGCVLPPPDFTADLLQALNDPNQLVQLQAARSLGIMGQQAGYSKALKYLDPSAGLKRSIAEQMGISQEDPQLQTELNKIRSVAALALGDIGRWSAASHLSAAIDDRNPEVALAAANAALKLLIKTNHASFGTIP